MNLSKFLVLGSLDTLEEGSGYDIQMFLENKQVDRWTDIKKGSIYFALKQLVKESNIEEVRQEKQGDYPVKRIFKITKKGKSAFDVMQEEAFQGLYPKFYGFKLGLKFNRRKTNDELIDFAKGAIKFIDNILEQMSNYKAVHSEDEYCDLEFFMRHDIYIFEAEKKWLLEVIEKLS